MGAATSVAAMCFKKDEQIIQMMMPVYFISDAVISDDDINCVQHAWNVLIIEDRSREFLRAQESATFVYSSCISWFYSVFYSRLFNVHPLFRPRLNSKGSKSGKSLVMMIATTINGLRDKDMFQRVVTEMAKNLCSSGVKPVEYGILGEVLLYSLHVVLGNEYTVEVDTAWRKIYSQVLDIIIPVCVSYERQRTHQVEEQ